MLSRTALGLFWTGARRRGNSSPDIDCFFSAAFCAFWAEANTLARRRIGVEIQNRFIPVVSLVATFL